MVELIVSDLCQMTLLEFLLERNNISYIIKKKPQTSNFGFETPYLIVNGIPLNFDKSLKWINENAE